MKYDKIDIVSPNKMKGKKMNKIIRILAIASLILIGTGAIQAANAAPAPIETRKSYLDAPPIPVADLLVNEEDPEAAHNILDDEYLVVYERQGVIIGQRMSALGKLLQAPFEISDSAGNKNPTVAYNLSTESYVVAWEDEDDIWAISVAGTYQDVGDQFYSPPFPVDSSSNAQMNPSIACNINDSSCLIVYEYYDPFLSFEIMAERVEVKADEISSIDDFLIVFEDFVDHERPDVVWGEGAGSYLVTWIREDGGDESVWYARIYDTDQGLSSEILTSPDSLWPGLSNNQRNQDAAYEPNTGDYLVVFDHDSGSNADIWGVRVPGSSGSPGVFDLIQIAYSGDSETMPAVAHFGGVYPTYDGAAAPAKLMVAYKQYDSLANAYYLQLRSVVLENSGFYLYDEGTVDTYDASDTLLEDIYLVGSWGDNHLYVIWEAKLLAANHYNIYALGLNTEYVFLPLIVK